MFYLIGQIILCLLIAFLFGVLIGWLLKAISCKKKFQKPESINTVKNVIDTPKSAVRTKSANATNVDNLKEILGVGPVLEKILNKNGIKSFRQVAKLNSSDIAELSTKLGSFKNRIVRDNWVVKAKELHFKKYGEKL